LLVKEKKKKAQATIFSLDPNIKGEASWGTAGEKGLSEKRVSSSGEVESCQRKGRGNKKKKTALSQQ